MRRVAASDNDTTSKSTGKANITAIVRVSFRVASAQVKLNYGILFFI
jgi:hypothetical protein